MIFFVVDEGNQGPFCNFAAHFKIHYIPRKLNEYNVQCNLMFEF